MFSEHNTDLNNSIPCFFLPDKNYMTTKLPTKPAMELAEAI